MTQYSRSHHPLIWALFGGGGVVLAFLTPALIIITGFMMPLIYNDDPAALYRHVLGFAQSWTGGVFLTAVISLLLFHASHRIVDTFHDLHVSGPGHLLPILFYGGSAVCGFFTIFLLVSL
ncbi:MAG: fumarate reductase subunit FrdD [Xanthomonadales bacterium]|nr:fumarate reductase subunit FrdD [Xanthomonadales bacterium]